MDPISSTTRKRIRDLVLEYARDPRKDRDRLLRDLEAIIRASDMDQDAAEMLMEESRRRFEWLRETRLPFYIQADLASIVDKAGAGFALTKRGIVSGVRTAVLPLLSRDASTREIEASVENVIGRTRRYFRTITRTSIGAFDSAKRKADAVAAGAVFFEYVGPPAERGFCRENLGKIYTAEEIAALDNGQRLDAFLYRGGWNCRHQWIPVFDYDRVLALRPDLAGVIEQLRKANP